MRVRKGRIFWGILILMFATTIICNLCGLFEWKDIDWYASWPCIPAALGIAALASGSFSMWNIGVVLVSVWLLLCNYKIIPVENGGAIALAIALGLAGIWLIYTAFFPRRKKVAPPVPPSGAFSSADTVYVHNAGRQSTIFDDANFICSDQPFTFGQYSTVFGDVCIDMRTASINDGARLEVSCVFGDVNILLPPNCRVRLEGSRVFGEVKTYTQFPTDETLPMLTIRHSTVFADIHIH